MPAFRIATLIAVALCSAAAQAAAPSQPAPGSIERFDPTPSGEIELVSARNPNDRAAIRLIRSRLASEAQRFGEGDFPQPDQVRGTPVPALAELALAGDKLLVTYTDLPDGASVSYSSSDPVVISAIHDWFAARLRLGLARD